MHHFVHLYVTHVGQKGQVAVRFNKRYASFRTSICYSCGSKGSRVCEDLPRDMHYFIDLYVTHVSQKGQVAVKI